jgi:prophage regulatory protein
MAKSATITLTINDRDHPALFPRDDLTEAQKNLVIMITKLAVAEYIQSTQAPPSVSTADRILRLPEVATMTGLSRSTIYLRVRQGTFPTPLSLGVRSVGWKDSQIRGWLNERMASGGKPKSI